MITLGHAEAWIGGQVTRWVLFCLRAPVLVVLVCGLGALALVPVVIKNLGVNSDTTDMIADTVPWQADFNRFRQVFPILDDLLIVVIDGDSPGLARTGADLLSQALLSSDSIRSIHRPGGGDFLARNGLLYLETGEIESLLDQVADQQPWLAHAGDPAGLIELIAQALETRGNDPRLRPVIRELNRTLAGNLADQRRPLDWSSLAGSVVGPSTKTRQLILVQAEQDFAAWRPGKRAMDAIRATAIREALTPATGVSVRLTGPVALQTEELDSVARGALQAGILALLMVAGLLYVAFRSVRLVTLTLTTLVVGLIYTAGFAAIAVGHLNLISVAFAVLYIGLGIDFGIHFILRFRELLSNSESVIAAVTASAGDVGTSLALCSLTTSLGFFAFLPTKFSGVAELGLISGVGMFISLLVTLSLLPAMLTLLPRPSSLDTRATGQWSASLGRWVARHQRGILIVAVLAGLGGLSQVQRVRFDANPVNLRSSSSESVSTYRDLLTDPMTSPMSLSVLTSPQDARKLAIELAALTEVERVVGLDDLVPAEQEEKLALIDELALMIPPLKPSRPVDSASMATALDRLSGAALRFDPELSTLAGTASTGLDDRHAIDLGSDLTRELLGQLERLNSAMDATPFTLEDLPAEWVHRWRSVDARWHRLQVLPIIELSAVESVAPFVKAVHRVAPHATGIPVVNLYGGQVVVGAFQQAFMTAAIAIIGLLFLLLRRPGDVLLVMVPLFLATPLTAAVTVLIDLPFNFANVITLPLLLGIGVDNGIHMVHRARHAPPADGNLLASSTARGVMFSAITTIVSFGNLAFSPHNGTASMGVLLSVGMLINLACTLLVLPALIHRRIELKSAT